MKKKSGTRRAKKTPASKNGHWVSAEEISRLQANLREAQETLEAIRSGEVDAVVVQGPNGNQIYSLTSAEQPYRVYVEQMQEGAVTVSSEGLILYCNQRFADMMQAPLERVISSKISAYLGPEAWRTIGHVFEQGNAVKYECALKRESGEKLPVHLTASRLPMENQNVMCLVVTDLTDQKKHEEVRLARELAEKASLAKDDFLAALSHELRTPLTPVLITTNALENNHTVPLEVRESLQLIRRNVELEARLIDDLLDLTRIAHGKMELQLKQMDFHAAIHRALEICRPEFNAKSQKIILDLNAREHQGASDSMRLQQAVWNLIRNAAKFTPEHGIITVHTANPAPGRICVEIHDTGIGFAAGGAEKLFEPFEQGGRHITRQFGGLGLGLAITRSIIEAHGGTIRASSDGIGKGATLAFEIPLQSISDAPADQAPSLADKKQMAVGKRILLVEDHEDTRTILESLLRRSKHEVKAAASAQEALKLATENRFDLVISDIGLPDESGITLMEQLRDQFGLKGIGLSGYGMADDIAKGRNAGFVRHLTKPIRFDRLSEAIAELSG
jgi:PAS domain S-box-containing protein